MSKDEKKIKSLRKKLKMLYKEYGNSINQAYKLRIKIEKLKKENKTMISKNIFNIKQISF